MSCRETPISRRELITKSGVGAAILLAAGGHCEASEVETVLPTDEALKALEGKPDADPVVMLNLLKYKPDGGAAAFGRYATAASKLVRGAGARVLFSGGGEQLLVGDNEWDAIILVQYPSRKAFLDMITSPEYHAISHQREEALERAVLYAISTARRA
jgi:uncharacterized protein (DUF1330 family)